MFVNAFFNRFKRNFEINFLKKINNKFNLKRINCYVIYIILITINMAFFLILFKIESNTPFLKHRRLSNLKKYSNNLKDGVGGAYIPDCIPTPISTLDYIIQKGDSIHSISEKFGLDEMTIVNYNNIVDPLRILMGSVIKIPNQDGILIRLDKKNNIEKVSEKYKIEKEEILRVNNISQEEINSDNIKNRLVFVPGIHFDSITKALILGEYFRAPVYGRFTSYFGFRKDPWTKLRSFHQGLDIANSYGTKIRAAASGKVIYVGEYWPLGLCVKIKHLNNYVTYYGHLSEVKVKLNSYVNSGQVIGLMGNSGRTTGTHLHFEVRKNGIAINPFRVTVF